MNDKMPMSQDMRTTIFVDAIAAFEILKENRSWDGQAIAQLRERMGLSIREFADRLGYNYTYLSKVENGKALPGRHLIERAQQLNREFKYER